MSDPCERGNAPPNDEWSVPIVLSDVTIRNAGQPEFQDPPIEPPEPTEAQIVGAFANSFLDWYDGLTDEEVAVLQVRYGEAGQNFEDIVNDARRRSTDAYVNEDYPD